MPPIFHSMGADRPPACKAGFADRRSSLNQEVRAWLLENAFPTINYRVAG